MLFCRHCYRMYTPWLMYTLNNPLYSELWLSFLHIKNLTLSLNNVLKITQVVGSGSRIWAYIWLILKLVFFPFSYSNMFSILCQQPSYLGMSTPGASEDIQEFGMESFRDSISGHGCHMSSNFYFSPHIYHTSTLTRKTS